MASFMAEYAMQGIGYCGTGLSYLIFPFGMNVS
jgi:hypothetical protein